MNEQPHLDILNDLRADKERLWAVLEAAEAALEEGEWGHVCNGLPHKGLSPSCAGWDYLRTTIAAIRQAEAEQE